MSPLCILPLFCSVWSQRGLWVYLLCKITWLVLHNIVYGYFTTFLDSQRQKRVSWCDQVKKVLVLMFLSIEINEVFFRMNSEWSSSLLTRDWQRSVKRSNPKPTRRAGEQLKTDCSASAVFFLLCFPLLWKGSLQALTLLLCLVVLVNPDGLCTHGSRSLCACMHSNIPAVGAAHSVRCYLQKIVSLPHKSLSFTKVGSPSKRAAFTVLTGFRTYGFSLLPPPPL